MRAVDVHPAAQFLVIAEHRGEGACSSTSAPLQPAVAAARSSSGAVTHRRPFPPKRVTDDVPRTKPR
ncbi:MAG: hypothetical protein U0736_12825 [Gemmataceae bacterium]